MQMKKIKNIFSIFLFAGAVSFALYLLSGPFLRVSSVEINIEDSPLSGSREQKDGPLSDSREQKGGPLSGSREQEGNPLSSSPKHIEDSPLSGAHKQMEEALSSVLKKHKGRLLWKISLKRLAEELNILYPDFQIHLARKLPDRLIVSLKKKNTALLLFYKGEFFSVSYTGEIGKKRRAEESFDFPILRGKKFWEEADMRKKALDILVSFPATGRFVSVQNFSEILYNEANDSLLFYLMRGNFILELNAAPKSEKINNILFVLNYLDQKKDRRVWIDARPEKKIIAKQAP